MDFIAIDFETACYNTDSACSVGIAVVDGLTLTLTNTEYFLIKPPNMFFTRQNIDVHGITPDMVESEPEFPAIWERIKHYFDGSRMVIAHNAQFDMSVLHECLSAYGLPFPEFRYICSIKISDYACNRSVPKSLDARAARFGVELNNHHNALEDAVACAEIVIRTIKASTLDTFDAFINWWCDDAVKLFSELNPTKRLGGGSAFEKIDYKSITADEDNYKESVFTGKNVVLTGEFACFSRKELSQILVNLGAIMKGGVTKQTDYLIVGRQDKKLVGDDGMSSKEEKVVALRDKGIIIPVIYENELMRILSNNLSGDGTNNHDYAVTVSFIKNDALQGISIDVLADGRKMASVHNGGTVKFRLLEGKHRLEITNDMIHDYSMDIDLDDDFELTIRI
ncbi:MAG: 3'-5' exoribonuclease [Clostridia bacterium]|nr:3'-5' exoribonuclease [Clostridia bacterium]